LHETVAIHLNMLDSWRVSCHYDVDDRPHLRAPDAHVVFLDKRCTLKDIKSSYADAALEGQALVICASGGLTRDAERWAAKAQVAAFAVYDGGEQLRAATPLAREHTPSVI
jgi:hypothetical protein